jgi:hypothetical protein
MAENTCQEQATLLTSADGEESGAAWQEAQPAHWLRGHGSRGYLKISAIGEPLLLCTSKIKPIT